MTNEKESLAIPIFNPNDFATTFNAEKDESSDYNGVGDFVEEEITQSVTPNRILMEKTYDWEYEQYYISKWQQEYHEKYIARKRSFLIHWWRSLSAKFRFIFFPNQLPTRYGTFYRD